MNINAPQKTVLSLFNDASRIVIKIGSALVVDVETLEPRVEWLEGFAGDVKALQDQGKELIIIASGAVALGRHDSGFSPDQKLNLPQKQVAATWGKQYHTEIMRKAFSKANVKVASGVVVEPAHLSEHDESYKNFRRTMSAILKVDGVPIINENDTVATEELQFGNNDVLAAQVTDVMNAELLIILSDVDGLYTKNPKEHDDAQHIPYVPFLTDEIMSMATDATSGVSTGGMASKVEAVKMAWDTGRDVIISDGTMMNPISKLMQGLEKSTSFVQSSMEPSSQIA